ncbi:MAG: PEGA domain-containing protein [Planctomycetes bacterium]|nr:PEGA domain-containing protein [Planctomycetota bacterium]
MGLLLVGFVLAGAAANGDVRRRLTVRSHPPGALVYIDDQQIGTTPASTSFIYYGARKIQLIKDGFKTLTVQQTFSPPWYEIPPLDFFSENLYSGELRDERVLDFQMEPETIPPTNELRERAEALRAGARAGLVAPPAIAPGGFETAPAPRVLSPTFAPPGAMAAPVAPQQFAPQVFAPQPMLQPSPQLLPRPTYLDPTRIDPGAIRPLPPP